MKKLNQSKATNDSEKYFDFYDLAPIGYFTLSRTGEIIQLNITGAKMLGKDQSHLINRLFHLFVSDISKPLFFQFFEKIFDTHEKESCELTFVAADDKPIYVSITGIVSENVSNCMITAIDITAQKQAEEALQVSEQKYRAIFNNIQYVFYQTDLSGAVLEVSPSIKNFSEFDREEIVGKPVTNIYFDPNDRLKIIDLLKQNGELRDYELRLRTKSGELKFVSNNARLVSDAQGKPNHIDGAIRDITERKQAEKQIQRLNRVYTVLSNINKTIVRVRDKQFLFEEACRIALENGGFMMVWMGMVNPATNKIDVVASSGKTLSYLNNLNIDLNNEALNSGPAGLVIKSGKCNYSNNIATDYKTFYWCETALEYGFRSLIALPIIVFGKTIGVYVLYSGEIDFFNDEEIKLLEELAHDISFALEFIESEKERIKAQEKIREKDLEFKKLSSNLPDLIFQFTRKPDGTYCMPIASEGIKNIFGCTPEDVINDIIPIYRVIHPDDIQRVIADIEYSAQHLTYYTCEFRVLLPGKPIKWIYSKSTPEKLPDGSVTWYGFNADISDTKSINAELIVAKEHAEESDRLKSAFLANMSHEIRTPMNGILGFTELLKEPDLDDEQRNYFVSLIEKSGARLLNIINDIIDISKIESGLMTVKTSEINVNEYLDHIFTFFQQEAETKNLKLYCKAGLPKAEAFIKTDSDKFYAILINLVKNALKYTETGFVEFGYIPNLTNLQFYVKDTGIGIPNDRQEAIFERFVQADISDKMARQGAGLGLSISKAYIEMLNGKIWVESQEENLPEGKSGGSTFYFTLPVGTKPKSKSDEIVDILKPVKEIQINPKVSGLKILIAEDDESSSQYISICVREFEKESIKVQTGKGALEACRNNPDIDLVLMDIQMPEMNGYEATRQIRQFNTKVIIIALTAFALAGDREKAIEAGCSDYIAKPVRREELSGLIQKYFGK